MECHICGKSLQFGCDHYEALVVKPTRHKIKIKSFYFDRIRASGEVQIWVSQLNTIEAGSLLEIVEIVFTGREPDCSFIEIETGKRFFAKVKSANYLNKDMVILTFIVL